MRGVQAGLRRLRGEERGSETVEFAVAATVFFTCIFGIFGVSDALYTYHFTSYAAREATRYAMVRGSTWKSTSCTTVAAANCMATAANVTSFVQNAVPAGISKGTALTVTTTWPGTALSGGSAVCSTTNGTDSPGCLVQVKVQYNFSYLMPFLPKTALLMKSTSETVILQ